MQKKTNKDHAKHNILLQLATFLKDHWVFTLIFVNLPAVWLPILYTFLGVQLRLVKVVNQSCQFTIVGFFLMIAMLAIIGIGNGAIIYDEKTHKKDSELEKLKTLLLEQTENGLVLRNLSSSANEICGSKLSTLMDKVNDYVEHPQKVPPTIISNPKRQLESLAKELSICLADLLKFQERRYVTELFTSIIYRFPQEKDKDWHWATPERGLSISALTTKHDNMVSTFRYLLDGKGHSVFRNSKQAAFDAGHYIPDNEDEYDENEKLKGSIACFQYEIRKNNKILVEFIITVTSYGQQFVQGMTDDDEIVKNIRYNLDKVVIPNYIVRAKIELCLLYLEQLNRDREL